MRYLVRRLAVSTLRSTCMMYILCPVCRLLYLYRYMYAVSLMHVVFLHPRLTYYTSFNVQCTVKYFHMYIEYFMTVTNVHNLISSRYYAKTYLRQIASTSMDRVYSFYSSLSKFQRFSSNLLLISVNLSITLVGGKP